MQKHSYCLKVCQSQRQLLLVSEHTQSTCLQYTLTDLHYSNYCMCQQFRVYGQQILSFIIVLIMLIIFTILKVYIHQECDLYILVQCKTQLLNPLDTWISDQWCGAQPVLKGVFAALVLEWNWRREICILREKF